MIRRRLLRSAISSNINVTPMADIMLVLLIIFMITTPLLQDSVTVNLPKAHNPLDTKTEKQVVLSLTREGHIYWGKKQLTEEEMVKALVERFTAEINKTIFVRADQTLAYGKVVHIVNECRKAGVDRVGLMTERESQASLN
jgi:biopolymer transport protein TolR